ncbi:TIGR04222 domain-containing membrane protein [Streptomyces cavernicola]|uniref:TIGR04222 domain-containing membrane protein n=1 Tax=Streptomyces cavernicola TaxID=3043613 RepID=A0ABT6SFF1_9ACTN|nr:TIGR04222 domain-containing membrane protein [Streptomyces sp. B-S-A6]MDI3406911.1 TIGR04222 domain-containing membrane protein [Streptomyces sp. B-S-A6]
MVIFLALLYYVVIGGSIIRLLVPVLRAARPSGSSATGRLLDPLEAAFLAGGPGRVADTVLTAMHADGLITVVRPGLVGVGRGVARHPVEQAVLDAHAVAPSSALEWVRVGVMRSPAVQTLGDGLAERGLLMRPAVQEARRRWAEWQMLLSFGAGPLAVVLTFVQFSQADRGGFGLPFVVLVLPACLAGFFGGRGYLEVFGGRSTGAGRRALRGFRSRADWNDPAHLVAYFGPGSAPDPLMREQLEVSGRMRVAGAGAGAGAVAGSAVLVGDAGLAWCGGGDGSSCGGSSCGSSSWGGSSWGGSSGGAGGGWSWDFSGGGSSCGGSSGGSSCGSSS